MTTITAFESEDLTASGFDVFEQQAESKSSLIVANALKCILPIALAPMFSSQTAVSPRSPIKFYGGSVLSSHYKVDDDVSAAVTELEAADYSKDMDAYSTVLTFANKLVSGAESMPPDFAEVLNQDLFDLV
jgi:hypothetical protein